MWDFNIKTIGSGFFMVSWETDEGLQEEGPLDIEQMLELKDELQYGIDQIELKLK